MVEIELDLDGLKVSLEFQALMILSVCLDRE